MFRISYFSRITEQIHETVINAISRWSAIAKFTKIFGTDDFIILSIN